MIRFIRGTSAQTPKGHLCKHLKCCTPEKYARANDKRSHAGTYRALSFVRGTRAQTMKGHVHTHLKDGKLERPANANGER